MARRVPFKTTPVTRYQLPGYERKGCVAQERVSGDLVFVIFQQTKTEVETITCLPVLNLAKKLYECVPKPKISDTIVVGYPKKTSRIVLVDLVMIDGKSANGKSWRDRLHMLDVLVSGFDSNGRDTFPVARQWSRGLMRAYDEVIEDNGVGLLVRIKGKAEAFMCA